MQKKKYNMAIVGLFVVVLLLFGLLSGLYVVNQSVTVQNRADVLDEPYIECVWDMTEPELEYIATIYEVDIATGDEKEVLSMGGDGSIIFHDVQPDKLYRCEITAMGESCGVDTYQFTRNPITLTPVPTVGDVPDKGESSDTSEETQGNDQSESDQSSDEQQNGDEPSPTVDEDLALTPTDSEDPESTSSGDESDPDAESTGDKGGALTSTPTPTESDEGESTATPSSTTATPTKASTTPPVSGLPGLSILLLIAGLAVVAFGLVL